MKNQLTAKQGQVLEFIVEFRAEHKYSPSVREIAAEFGIQSPMGAARHIDALVKKGYITKQTNLARSIVPV